MHKIIVLITPVEGHFNPFVPIITKLIKKRHKVVCITGKVFKTKVINTGAEFIPLPSKWDPGEKEIYNFFPELKKKKGLSQIKYYLKHVMLDSVPDALNMLGNVLEEFPADLVISDSFMIAGTWITQLDGPPNVRLSVLPLSLPGENMPPFGLGLLPGKSFFSKLRNKLLNTILDRLLFKDVHNYINEIRKSFGLPPFDKNFRIRGIESSNLFLHASTPAFEYSRSEYPANFRFIGSVLVAPQVEFNKSDWWSEIENNVPLILINQGTVAKNYENLIYPAIEALKDEKMIIVAVPVKDGEIKNLPDNVHTASYIPFGNILPHVELNLPFGR